MEPRFAFSMGKIIFLYVMLYYTGQLVVTQTVMKIKSNDNTGSFMIGNGKNAKATNNDSDCSP